MAATDILSARVYPDEKRAIDARIKALRMKRSDYLRNLIKRDLKEAGIKPGDSDWPSP